MTSRREELIARMERTDRMIKAAIAGEDVFCDVCALKLTYYGPASGRHPGVYCETGCTKILMNISNDETRLDTEDK
jgi:hypothetical protein